MFAINHAAAALIFKKKVPKVKMFWLLISVQLVEILWVAFNYLGIERTTTEPTVRYVGNIHLIHMPFSHSLLTTVLLSLAGYIAVKYFSKSKKVALAISLAIASHFVLDLVTHGRDLAITYFALLPKIGSGLYVDLPYVAFLVELGFGVYCWWYYKGNKTLLATIIIFNLANFTIFSPDVVGLEKVFAGEVTLLVSVILAQIIITLVLVGLFSRDNRRDERLEISTANA